MSLELQMLLFSVCLGILQVFIGALSSTTQRGLKWNMSSREGQAKELHGMPARLDRALQNFKETFPFFAAAILMAHVSGRLNEMTILGAQLYFYSRLAYLPVYAFGIPVVRSLIWLASIAGIVMVLAPLFGL